MPRSRSRTKPAPRSRRPVDPRSGRTDQERRFDRRRREVRRWLAPLRGPHAGWASTWGAKPLDQLEVALTVCARLITRRSGSITHWDPDDVQDLVEALETTPEPETSLILSDLGQFLFFLDESGSWSGERGALAECLALLAPPDECGLSCACRCHL